MLIIPACCSLNPFVKVKMASGHVDHGMVFHDFQPGLQEKEAKIKDLEIFLCQ